MWFSIGRCKRAQLLIEKNVEFCEIISGRTLSTLKKKISLRNLSTKIASRRLISSIRYLQWKKFNDICFWPRMWKNILRKQNLCPFLIFYWFIVFIKLFSHLLNTIAGMGETFLCASSSSPNDSSNSNTSAPTARLPISAELNSLGWFYAVITQFFSLFVDQQDLKTPSPFFNFHFYQADIYQQLNPTVMGFDGTF